jgi:hypothetical protein
MSADLVLRLTGGTYNSDPALSLGGETSAWAVALQDLWPEVAEEDAIRGRVDHRALDLLNLGNQGARRIHAWTAPSDNVALGYSDRPDWNVRAAASELPPRNQFGELVALAFYGVAAPLELPEISPGKSVRLWLRRTIPQGSGAGMDAETLKLRWL